VENRPRYCAQNVESLFVINVPQTRTRNVIDACVSAGVKQLIFTSSASVVFEGKDLINADESHPICKKFPDYYSESKAVAERLVLEANGRAGLLTCSIRPSAIFGPRDVQAWPEILNAARGGKSKYQIGNGRNLTDYTYVENVALAHVLASDKLRTATVVAGKAYFITNDEPIPFWDMPIFVYKSFGYPAPRIRVPFLLAYYLSLVVDLFVWLLSPFIALKPTFTSFRISIAGCHRTYNISRAKNDLGYRPRVSLLEGMRRSLDYFKQVERNIQQQ